MNAQAHMSGQVPNQNGNPLPPPQMQNLAAASTGGGGPPPNQYSADPELLRARNYMREKIISMLMQKSVQPVNEGQRQKVKELTIRLEEELFKAAQTKDDYMNLSTLESRLSNLIRGPTVNSHSQRHVQLVNSSPPIGNMIPTPGMPHNANSNMMVSSVDTMMVTSSGCDNIAPISVNSGNMLSTDGMHGGSFSRADGTLSNGYQQSRAPILDYEPPIFCKCGLKAPRWISWTDKHPGQRFYKCAGVDGYGGCDFFQWVDGPITGWFRKVIMELRDREKEMAERIADLEAENARLTLEKLKMQG